MPDRTPQQFGGVPDGVTDSTAAIQAAIDAWQPGDQVVLSGGTFRTGATITIPDHELVVRGDATVRARVGYPTDAAMFEVSGHGVVFDGDGLTLDQADVMVSGRSIATLGAAGLQVVNLISRGTQRSFLWLGSGTTDLLVDQLDHQGKGHGVLASDPSGLTRLEFRRSTFVHPGAGSAGDGIQLNCPTHGASEVSIVGCTARGYIGEAVNMGMGFGFSRVTDGRIIGCLAEQCEGDGFHFERNSHRWLCADLRAFDIGVPLPVGGNGSGLVAYDSDDITVLLMAARNCGYHGIALSGQGKNVDVPSQLRANGLIERCSIDTTRRDGIHVTAQIDFRIHRNWVRDPSLGSPELYAGIHVARQGDTTLENTNGTGANNTVVLSGQTTALAALHIRPQSVNVVINGEGPGLGTNDRVTEAGEPRVTEGGELRVLEAA